MQTVDNNIFNPNEEQRRQLPAELFNILITSNIGPMLVNRHDRYVGGSLINYGELCRGEATLFSRLLYPDDVVIEAGANIGAHTALLSKLVGEEGTVYAFEPQRIVFQTLCANLALNQCTNVIARQQGVGSAPGEMIVPAPDPRADNNFGGLSLLTQGDGETVSIVTIDSLRLPRCHLIKADVEGMEAAVLAGAQETIQRCRPILYLENDRQEKSAELIAMVMALGYRLWWHIVPLFEPNNFAGNTENIFGGTVSVNMLCQPAELALPVADLPEIQSPFAQWQSSALQQPTAIQIGSTEATPNPSATIVAPVASAEDEMAEPFYQSRLAANPTDHAALHMLGLLAFAADDLTLAIEQLTEAIAIDDTVAAYHSDLGEIYRLAGQPEKSALAGRRAVALTPDSADAHYRLGLAYDDAGHRAEALNCYRRATQCDPKHFLGWYYLGQGLAEQGDAAAAITALTHAVSLVPDHAETQHALGLLLRDRGECMAARHCFEMALRARPDYVAAHAHLAPLKTYKKDDPHFAVLTDLYARRGDMHDRARALCCFAYAKMCEDTGEHEQAFAAYAESNRIKATLLPFDEAREDARTAATLRLFDRSFVAARQQPAAPAAGLPTPIFIVSMPHAGAGWLERMLTQHPLAGAAHVDFGDLLADATQPFPDLAATLDAAAWRALGERYLQLAAQQAPGKIFVIDRNPENVRYLGLIHLALPQARIVHVMRDPLDSCFSLYASNAEPDIGYSHDLELLGRQYVRYINLMRHWHAVLPPRTIADVHYEDLVREAEQQMRRVVEFAGLSWTDRCLQPPPRVQNQRTHLSARWRNFAQHLEPLYASVKHYRQADGADNPLAEARRNTLLSRANQLYAEDRFAEALAHYDQALAIRPNDASALVNKGIVLRDLRRPDEAIVYLNAALALSPEMAIARFNLGSLQLMIGDWQAGWENYEARWYDNDQAQKGILKPPPALRPQWNGETNTEHQKLLIFTEQGAGDNLHFARYLTLALQRFARVGFVCPQSLWRLMEWSFGDRVTLLTTVPKNAAIWDWQCSLMSLPRVFQTRPDSIPATTPYLKTSRAAQAYWRARLDARHTARRPRIGISWAGNKNYLYDKRRSLDFRQLQALWSVSDVTWVNLQVRPPKDAPPPVPENVDWIDWTMELADFADTAALVANLDLVISIDSAIAHLAGALGRPTWLLNRFESEWRWLLNREDSPWYPTMRIFNQPSFGDWDSVLQSIAQALRTLENSPSGI